MDYSDIIHLPHHTSNRHKPMSLHERAAQFAPFSALTGYATTIAEVGCHTDKGLFGAFEPKPFYAARIHKTKTSCKHYVF